MTLLFSLSFMDIGTFASEAEQPVTSILEKDYNTDKSGYNIQNTRYFEFATIDGGKVSNHAQNGRGKILFFGSQYCDNTKGTLKNLASSDFGDVDIVYLESDYSFSVKGIENLRKEYGNQSDDIEYAYSEDYTTFPYMLEYSDMVKVNVDTFPLLVYIDGNNMIQYAESKEMYSAEHVREIVDTYIHTDDSIITIEGMNKWMDGSWYYFKNGKIDTTYTGMAKNEYGWWYMKNGKLDTTYTGLAQNEYGWWYVKTGKVDTNYIVTFEGR